MPIYTGTAQGENNYHSEPDAESRQGDGNSVVCKIVSPFREYFRI